VEQDPSIPAQRKDFAEDGIQISGNNIYVLWNDRRPPGIRELYFNRSTDGGVTWGAEQPLPVSATDDVKLWRMAVVPGAPDKIFILVSTETTTGSEELYLNASTDGGASFNGWLYVPSPAPSAFDVDSCNLAAAGSTIHMAYVDNRSGNDQVYYARSSDDGVSIDISDTLISSGISDIDEDNFEWPIGICTEGATVAIAFEEEDTPAAGIPDNAYCNTSLDGGATWGGPVLIGPPTPGIDDCDYTTVACNNGNIVVAHEDNRAGGSDNVYVNVSTDGGVTFSETQVSPAPFAGFPTFTISTDAKPHDAMALGWTQSGGAVGDDAFMSYSRDGGLTWSAGFDISDTELGDADFARGGYNALYNNFVICWRSDDTGNNAPYVGGFRPQTSTASGAITIGTNVSWSASCWPAADAGKDYWVIASTALGNFRVPFGDGRNTKLAHTALFRRSKGKWTGTIDAAGNGTTNGLNIPANPLFGIGDTIYFIGLARSGNNICSITDVVAEVVN
jgi:hypothetical protein